MSNLDYLRTKLSDAFEAGLNDPDARARQEADPADLELHPKDVSIGRRPDSTGRIKRHWIGFALLTIALVLSLDGGLLLPLVTGIAAAAGAYLVLAWLGSGRGVVNNENPLAAALAKAEAERHRAEQSSAAKQRLLATVAHDLRTPLTGLLGMADLLDGSRLAAEQRNYVAGLRQSGEMLSYLVEDLLDFATMEAGRFELRRVSESPRRLIESVVEMLASRAHFKGLEIASFVAPEVPEQLALDPGRLRQVLYNVIGNAVKFTQRGGILVSVHMEGGELVMAVADTGPGISSADRELIFDEFVQVGSDESRGGGKGLGLSITSRIVHAFGGRMSVDSSPGEGSTFTIRLPARASGGDVVGQPRHGLLSGSAVLLLAPSGPGAYAVERTIAALGGQCLVCPDPQSATQALADGHINGKTLTDIIVDHRLERHYLGDIAQSAEVLNLRRVFLVNPEERQARINGPYDAWLIRPLRERSLIDVLTGRLRGLERRGATNDNLPHETTLRNRQKARRRLILLGEDDPVNTLLIRAALERDGNEVVSASDFEALVALVRDTELACPDLIISDLNMPAGKIGNVFAALAERHLMTQVPVLVLTGELDPAVCADVMMQGAAAVVGKPVMPQDLLRQVADLLMPPVPEIEQLELPDQLPSERTLH